MHITNHVKFLIPGRNIWISVSRQFKREVVFVSEIYCLGCPPLSEAPSYSGELFPTDLHCLIHHKNLISFYLHEGKIWVYMSSGAPWLTRICCLGCSRSSPHPWHERAVLLLTLSVWTVGSFCSKAQCPARLCPSERECKLREAWVSLILVCNRHFILGYLFIIAV